MAMMAFSTVGVSCFPGRVQYRMKVGAIDAAAFGPFKKQAHGHGRENEKSLLHILVAISLAGTISGKSLKLLPPDVVF